LTTLLVPPHSRQLARIAAIGVAILLPGLPLLAASRPACIAALCSSVKILATTHLLSPSGLPSAARMM